MRTVQTKNKHPNKVLFPKSLVLGSSCSLDGKGLVGNPAGAVIDERQLQAAERRGANLVFDSSDFHKLLVLINKNINSCDW